MPKKLLKRAGASAMAAAMVITGLSFGPAAATAAPSSGDAAVQAPFVLGQFVGFEWNSTAQRFNAVTKADSYDAAARAASKSYTFPKVGSTGKIRSVDGKCIYRASGNDVTLRPAPCDALPSNSESDWTMGSDGQLRTAKYAMRIYTQGNVIPNFLGGLEGHEGTAISGPVSGMGLQATTVDSQNSFGSGEVTLTGSGTPGAEIRVGTQKAIVSGSGQSGTWTMTVDDIKQNGTPVTLEQYVNVPGATWQKYDETTVTVSPYAFTAAIKSVDLAARTALITGTSDANAYVVINDSTEVQADSEGIWDVTVRGLILGATPVLLEQFVNAEKVGEITVTVNLDVRPIAAQATFARELADAVSVDGTAQPGATIEIRDENSEIVASTLVNRVTGRYNTTVPAPNKGGDYYLTVSQTIDGERVGDTPITIPYGSSARITTPVDGLVHKGGPIDFEGKGEAGAQIKIQEKGKEGVLKAGTVLASSSWNLRGVDLNDEKRTLVVTQTGKGNNVTTAEVSLNPDGTTDPGEGDITNPVVETPSYNGTVTTSRPTFTGTGHKGATVTIGYGKNSIIGTTTVKDNGEWTITPTAGLSLGKSHLIVTQTSGKSVETIEHVINRVAAEQPLRVTSHTNNQSYSEGVTTFRGVSATNATIKAVNQWGTVMGTTTADDNGNWAFNRNLGPTTAGYDITFTATANGKTETAKLHLNYAGVIAFEVTTPTHNSTYEIGTATFRGKAAANTEIVATNQWGTVMGKATAGLNNEWTFSRYLGPTTAGYDITFVATKGTDTQRTLIHLNQKVTNVPVTVTSIKDGDTYTPGMNILRGSGTPGATVSAVNATNGWNVPMGTAKVKENGTWELPERNWGPTNDYEIKVTQTNPDKTTSTTTVKVFSPVFKALVVDGYSIGAPNGPGVFATFTGKATPGATVTIKSASTGTAYQTVTALPNGTWTATRTWNTDHTYNLVFDQTAKDGKTDSVAYGPWQAK